VSRWCGFLINVLEVAVSHALVESVLLNVSAWAGTLLFDEPSRTRYRVIKCFLI
jgi:hypothetical protein